MFFNHTAKTSTAYLRGQRIKVMQFKMLHPKVGMVDLGQGFSYGPSAPWGPRRGSLGATSRGLH